MNPTEAPPAPAPKQGPRGKYTMTPAALAAKRANLVKANAVLKEIGCVLTAKRQAASRANLAKGRVRLASAPGTPACG